MFIEISSVVVSVVSLLFAFWTWDRARTREHELRDRLRAVHDISAGALQTVHVTHAADERARLHIMEQAVGKLEAIHRLTAESDPHDDPARSYLSEFLYEQRILWTASMMFTIERSTNIKEIWVFTPDFEPDLSGQTTGRVVRDNLHNGKRYVYFVPESLQDLPRKELQLRANVGLDGSKAGKRYAELLEIVHVPISIVQDMGLRGTICFYFAASGGQPRAFEEIFPGGRVADRGTVWQELSESETGRIRRCLEDRRPPPTQSTR